MGGDGLGSFRVRGAGRVRCGGSSGRMLRDVRNRQLRAGVWRGGGSRVWTDARGAWLGCGAVAVDAVLAPCGLNELVESWCVKQCVVAVGQIGCA